MGEPLARGLSHRRAIGGLRAIIEGDEDVTATEATKADGGALGLKLVTIGELDAHREEGPELIGSEAVEDIGEAGKMFCAKELELPLGREWHVDIAGFSRPQLEPEEESPEEAHPRRHIAKAL